MSLKKSLFVFMFSDVILFLILHPLINTSKQYTYIYKKTRYRGMTDVTGTDTNLSLEDLVVTNLRITSTNCLGCN